MANRAFYFGFQRNGVPFSALWLKYGSYDADPALVTELTNKAQSICKLYNPFLKPLPIISFVADFFNLVLMQWFNLLSTRTRRLSLFQQNPITNPRTRNLYLFPAMLLALGLAWLVFPSDYLCTQMTVGPRISFFSYIPALQNAILTRGVGVEFFFLPMA